MRSSTSSCVVPSRPPESVRLGTVRAPGQATIEFALVLPLFIVCTAALVLVTIAGVRTLSLADLARNAARAASVADDPCRAAAVIIGDRAVLDCAVSPMTTTGAADIPMVRTVRVDLRERAPFAALLRDGPLEWLGASGTHLAPRASSVMVLEPPPVLG